MAELLTALHSFLERHWQVAPHRHRFLLAVSGGKDSVVLLHFLHHLGWDLGVAHANFQLRDAESDEDEGFVRNLAHEFNLPCFSESFSTKTFAEREGVGIQEAARALRYDWLEKIATDHGFDWVVTAHHRDDSIETLLFNFLRGSGLLGLTGIPERNGSVIRPLILAPSTALDAYYRKHRLEHREDSSNATDAYTRNRIRHQLVPLLKTLNPTFPANLEINRRHFVEALAMQQWASNILWDRWVKQENGRYFLEFTPFKEHKGFARTLLFEWLSPFGFKPGQLSDILKSLDRQAGSRFFSPSYELLADRETFILQERTQGGFYPVLVHAGGESIEFQEGKRLSQRLVEAPEPFDTTKDRILVNAELLQFPLTLRPWQQGDWFCPFGMEGKRKKLQDFYSDLKLNRFEKENIPLLINGDGAIIWVVGFRLDHRFRIQTDTKRVVEYRLQDQAVR